MRLTRLTWVSCTSHLKSKAAAQLNTVYAPNTCAVFETMDRNADGLLDVRELEQFIIAACGTMGITDPPSRDQAGLTRYSFATLNHCPLFVLILHNVFICYYVSCTRIRF